MNKTYQKGLSLMEVLITLIIVAIVAGLAYPRYKKMVTRSKQTEAKTILKSIYIGQDLYRTTNQEYAQDISDLDIEIPSDSIYRYTIVPTEDPNQFIVKAVSNIDNDPISDEWTIDQNNNLINTVNDVIE